MGIRVKYAESLYLSKILKQVAQEYLALLPEDVDTLVSKGSSGCAIATAILMQSERLLYHVAYRKEGEDSHTTSGYAGEFGKCEIAIVDDFVAGGNTIKSIIDILTHNNYEVTAILVNRFQNFSGGKYIVSLIDKGVKVLFTNPEENEYDLKEIRETLEDQPPNRDGA